MNICRITSIYTCLVLAVTSSLASALAQCAQSVPARYSVEYSQLNQAIGAFANSLNRRPQTASNTAFATELESAGAGYAYDLIQTNHMPHVQQQLQRIQALGVQAVTIQARFPLLVPAFYQWNGDPADYAKFLTFYKSVIQKCHAAGIKVVVEAGPMEQATGMNIPRYCQTLSSSQYQNLMAIQCVNLASCQPDCISIVAEPDTDYNRSAHKAVYQSPTELAAFVQVMTSAILVANSQIGSSQQGAGSVPMIIAAGASSWMKRALIYDNLFCQVSGLTAIDIHTYFAGNGDLEAATAIADAANAAGKQVISSETWLNTVGAGSPPSQPYGGGLEPLETRPTNSFSFWEPLDAQYMYAWATWCKVEHPAYMTFFDPFLLFAYVDYNQVGKQSYSQIWVDETSAEEQAINAGTYSPIGLYFSKLISSQ
jgi:hypothetical protein